MIEIRWHGRGGQGSFTGAKLLGVAASIYEGKYAQAFPSFGPERRGAPVLGFNRISDTQIRERSEISKCNFIVFLDDTLWNESYLNDLKEDSFVLINTDKEIKGDKRIKCLNATQLALDIMGKPIANTGMFGFLIAFADKELSSNSCIEAIKATMKPSIAGKNVEIFNEAYKLGKEIL
jgi:pyruvate ferredoxin oxidoreductase gamma subunit